MWLEDPGYQAARSAFLGTGAAVVPVPVDREGLQVEAGIARAPRARLAYVTPSHQLPLGLTLSVTRRLALLSWAKREDAYILEDDYDSEYRYSGRLLAALQTLDDVGRVIYVGSFSKTLFPALRLGFLVQPPPLVQAAVRVRGSLDVQPPALEQRVLAKFIHEGHYARHLRRMRKLYAERREALLTLLAPLPLEVDAPPAGLHCVGWLSGVLDEHRVIQRAAEEGLELWPMSAYCLEPLKRQGILLGYASASPRVMEDGVKRLGRVLSAL